MRAVERVERFGYISAHISMASLSITLATNALVEGQGDRICLIYIGFRDGDVAKNSLSEVLKGDPVLEVKGGHSQAGAEVCPPDKNMLCAQIMKHNGVSAFAVASQFAARNPAH